MTVKDDLRKAALTSTHKRNRSPDDGFQLVGDRRRNVGKIAQPVETSSDDENDLNISEMCTIAQKNAYELHKEHEKRQRREQKRAAKTAQYEEEAKAARKAAKREEKKKEILDEMNGVVDATDLKF